MIGQRDLSNRIQIQIDNDKLPRFLILVGSKGSGKKTFAHMISNMLDGSVLTRCDTTVEAVRGMIAEAYRMNGVKVVYLIPDADSMSLQAKNALLKVTEEPPNSSYFIMTLEDENNTLDTIRSRGTVFYMDPYTSLDIAEYSSRTYELNQDEINLCKELCDTPGEVNTLVSMGMQEFYHYVELTADHIQDVSIANALKMGNRISLKNDDADNYDLRLFWKAFIKICAERMMEEHEYSEWIRITSKALSKLRIRGVNKQMLFDNWIFEIREWR